jgi:hypothetical protein
MTWLRRRSSSPEAALLRREAIREQKDGDIYRGTRGVLSPSIYPGNRPISRPPNDAVQRRSEPAAQSDRRTGTGHQAPAVGDFPSGQAPSTKDAAKLAASIIWRTAPPMLTGEQVARALGLSVSAFERKIESGDLRLESKSGPGDRVTYQRDAVRSLILAM